MPTYEYECQNCGTVFEAFQSMTDAPLRKCPECSGKVKRLLGTGAGVVFKGSGFYETDYKRKSTSASSSEPAKGDSGKKSDTPAAGASGKDSSPKSSKSAAK